MGDSCNSTGAAVLAFNAVTQLFVRQSQARAAAQEGERAHALEQQPFETQRGAQRRAAKERRDREWAMADEQRQTALGLQENQKVLDHWPLRLFPSQILQLHRGDGPIPLRVLLSLPANGSRDLEGPVRQALQQFVSNHYNFNLQERPIELLDGAWKDGQFQGMASIKALHERLRSEPTLVLETQMPEGDDFLYVNLAYWGPGQEQCLYQPLERIAYRPLVEASARDRAEQWREERTRLIEAGLVKDAAAADRQYGGVRALNLKRLEQEETFSAHGIDVSRFELPPFTLVKEDYHAIHQFLIAWHCLAMGWIGDLYHFAYWDTPPLLPTLLPDLLYPGFPPEVTDAFLDHYCRSYRAVAAECPAWAPELALQLVRPLAALPDPAWAIDQLGQAIQDWLAWRGLPAVTGTGDSALAEFIVQAGAVVGPVGPALLADPGFLAGLRAALDRLRRSDLLERLGVAERAAATRQEQERLERARQAQERAEAVRQAALLVQDVDGWSPEQMQGLQRSVAEGLGLEPVLRAALRDGGEAPEMVLIPPGSFLMGAPDSDQDAAANEKPRHRVLIPSPFAMGRYPVTCDDYDRFCADTRRERPGDRGWGRARRPVIDVSWEAAVAYCAWLSQQTGRRFRLPTEAEWEYAARAGAGTRYWWGNAIGQGNANCAGGGSRWDNQQTAPVGSFSPNPFGLYDTAGNVWEWVQDGWHDSYVGAPADGSEWHEACVGVGRVLRGGSWNSYPWGIRVSNRLRRDPDFRSVYLGLRLAQDL